MSQVTSFTQCGMRYRLERRDGVPQPPAWWNVAGHAFHETIREWETQAAGILPLGAADMPSPDAAAARFAHHLAEQTAETVLRSGIGPHHWRVGGKVSQQYPNKEDRTWWLDKGPEMVAQYVLAQQGRDTEVYRLADGQTLALELGFMLRLDGLPPLKGYIDQVLYDPRRDAVLIRDLKSGSSFPVDSLQLKVYRLALEDCFGVTAAQWWGDFWRARKGEPTKGVRMTDRAAVEREVRYRVSVMDESERRGLYAPNPGNNCSSCGVRALCPAMSDHPQATWRAPTVTVDAPTPTQ